MKSQTLMEPVNELTFNKNSHGRLGSRQFNHINFNESTSRYRGQNFINSSQPVSNHNRALLNPNKTYSQALKNTYSNIKDNFGDNIVDHSGNNDN